MGINKVQFLGYRMYKKPENFKIDEEGRVFTKCDHCTDWHIISKLNPEEVN